MALSQSEITGVLAEMLAEESKPTGELIKGLVQRAKHAREKEEIEYRKWLLDDLRGMVKEWLCSDSSMALTITLDAAEVSTDNLDRDEEKRVIREVVDEITLDLNIAADGAAKFLGTTSFYYNKDKVIFEIEDETNKSAIDASNRW